MEHDAHPSTQHNGEALMMNAEEAKSFIDSLKLKHGSHQGPEEGLCIMEAVAYVSGEPFSDHPKCASPVLTRFCIKLNDRWGDEDRQKLKPFVLRLAGTATTTEIDRKRAYMCADWALREILPMSLDAAKLADWSDKLRALPEVVDPKTAEAGRELATRARAAARALWKDNAAVAAYSAAAAAAAAAVAAYSAAAAAAAAAVADAAADAADAAADAADAAADAADAARAKANASALALLDRLISLTEKKS